MRKTITALILSLSLLFMAVACLAADSASINTADALNALGLFLGTGNGYELENGLTRAQGVTLLVRMIGKEEAAGTGVYDNAFTDVPDWAAGYIGYAYENGITNGTGTTTFSPDAAMTDYMFLTLVLRALEYSDKGEAPLFVWDDPYALAYDLGLIGKAAADTDFTRADAITVFWKALDIKLNGTDTTLASRLVAQGVITADELAEAREIQENGRKENADVPVVPTPETQAPETQAPETQAPETQAPETQAPETEAPEPEEDGGEGGPNDPNAGEEDVF